MNNDYYSTYNLFHGTTRKALNEIFEKKEFTFKKRKNHWIGNGVYFFVDDYNKALWWANEACRLARKNGVHDSKKAVIFLQGYRVPRSKIIDLDTEQDRQKINDFITSIPFGMKINNTSEEEKRCTLIDLYVKYEDIYATKKTFRKAELAKHSKLTAYKIDNNEVQFCVFKQETIDFDNISERTGG